MSEAALLLLVVAVTGIYVVRWTRRLAPPGSELPVKTLAATALAAAVVLAEFTPLRAGASLRAAAVVLGPLYVFAPLALTTLARAGWFGLARGITDLLYWTPSGRDGIRRLLTQVALRRGDADAAAHTVPGEAPLLQAQLHALREEWDEVLRLPVGGEGDNVALAEGVRVQALLALDRVEEAEGVVSRLRERALREDAGPILTRVAQVASARLAAARGRLAEAQRALTPTPAGVPPHELFALLAQAAERGGHGAAGELWTRAYVAAPPPLRERFARKLRQHDRQVPSLQVRRPVGTSVLTVVITAAYLAQVAIDRFAPALPTPLGRLDPSTAAAAFLVNIPAVPQGEAWWRFLSYAFVHGNLVHILLNAWVLYDVGRMYELRRGWGDLVAAFALGTAMGAYLTVVAQGGQVVVLVGASGGVLGVAGALLADVLRGRGAADRVLTRSLIQWMGLIALLSVAIPNVSLWGHVGGVVGGLLWGFVRQGLPAAPGVGRTAGAVAAGALALAAVAAGSVAMALVP